MIELFHFTRKDLLAPILTHGLFPSAKFHDLGLEMRRNVLYCWLSPDDDRMGYRENPEYECLKALVEPERCLVADMDLATLAYQYMRGAGGKDRDLDQARHYADVYRSTAVPVDLYQPGLFGAPEVLVKGPVSADQLTATLNAGLPVTEGQVIQIKALRYDGTPYRWWEARVERVTSDCIVTYAPVGCVLHQPNGSWQSSVAVRGFYWTDRPYNLLEYYSATKEKSGLYANVASPAQLVPGGIQYCDYELDVDRRVGQAAKVLDEEEFEEAAIKYGYSPEFKADCRRVSEEVLRLVDAWIWPFRGGEA